MSMVTLKGNPITISGSLPAVNSKAPDFVLTDTNLQDVSLKDYAGKRVILNIFPSVDTGVCAASVRKFNQDAASLENTVVLCVSEDLPFAHARFCGAEGIRNVQSLSTMRTRQFGADYGVMITSGPLAGVLSRAVVVLDQSHKVIYTEQVPEIAQEPDYAKAIASLK